MQLALKRCKHFELGGEKKTKGAALTFVGGLYAIWIGLTLSSERVWWHSFVDKYMLPICPIHNIYACFHTSNMPNS